MRVEVGFFKRIATNGIHKSLQSIGLLV